MISLSNGHTFRYMVASGALAFDGRGWFWERPLVWLGLIKPELFTVVLKTLTYKPLEGNLRWWKPWECVRLLSGGGAVNKVGLTNPGIARWILRTCHKINFQKTPLIASIFGTEEELVTMASALCSYDFVAIEINPSCPNTGHAMDTTEAVIQMVKSVKMAPLCHLPIIVKVSVDQDYLAIARGLRGIAEAISLNSVPWRTAFPNGERSPLRNLEDKVGGGGGGVSGKPAQHLNWTAVRELSEQGSLPVIGPSVMEFGDMARVRELGARAVSFGAIHLRTPWRPTLFVERENP